MIPIVRNLRSKLFRVLFSVGTACLAAFLGPDSAATAIVHADETPAAAIGKAVAEFSLPDARGQLHALSDYQGKIVVLAFLGTECPLAKIYAPRLRDLAAKYEGQGVVVLGIDANLQDSLTEIGTFAQVHGTTFPILKDNNNVLADRLHAQRTPEAFLLDREHVLRYWGRIDDQYGFKTGAGYVRARPTEHHLADAIDALLAGKPVATPVAPGDGCLIGRIAKTDPHGDITYTKHIAHILQNHCVKCHRDGEAAPFAMNSYDEVVGWSSMIREVVDEGRMPPWFADPRYGHFSNDARLSDEEKQQIYTWVENGCPQGDDQDLPAPRTFASGWQMGEPDEVIYMSAEPFDVPAEGVIEYQYFMVDPGWKTDKWIEVCEPRPGNRAVVHHINVHVQPETFRDPFPREGIGTYGPGFPPNILPAGTAIHVPANSKLEFQIHYTTNGTPQQDRSMLGVRFVDPRTVTKIVRQPYLDRKDFRIPPGDANYVISQTEPFFRPVLVLSLLPHMHLRGKSFRYEVSYPDGTSEVLLDVPRFDFNWQLRYVLKEPKLIPVGSVLKCTAAFDNSTDNPANPDPTRTVTFGQQTWDEMMEGAYSAIDADQDIACIVLQALALVDQEQADKE